VIKASRIQVIPRMDGVVKELSFLADSTEIHIFHEERDPS
jgi:hypothetical protein